VGRQAEIQERLSETFGPTHLGVENESHQHSVAPGSETHFAVIVVSDAFEGLPLVARHRRVNESLRDVFAGGLHALRIHALTPDEYAARPDMPPAPPCLGGSKRKKAASAS
jgi:BolA protein